MRSTKKLKTNKPVADTDLKILESILFDENNVGSKQKYIDNYGVNHLANLFAVSSGWT